MEPATRMSMSGNEKKAEDHGRSARDAGSALRRLRVAELLAGGWELGSTSNYRTELGLDTAELDTFLGDQRAAQYEQFKRLIDVYGSLESAQREVAKRVASNTRPMPPTPRSGPRT